MTKKLMFGLSLFLTCGLLCSPLMAQDEEKTETSSTKDTKVDDEKEPVMLTIGSVAPQLDIEHWVSDGEGKFKHIKRFEKGNVYVVEFWATWCGPCIASMPHISELQDKYGDKGVQIVSVSDEDLETVEEFLRREVRGEDDKTYADLTKNYCLTTDPDRTVSKDYMEAASQNGIPTAFIVGKEGHIEWIGHPMEIDEPIAAVVDGSWNRKEFAEEFIASQKVDAVINEFYGLLQGGKTEEAMKLIDSAIAETKNEAAAGQLKMMKLQIVVSQKMQSDPKEALTFLDETIATTKDEEIVAVARSMRMQIAISIGGEEAVKALDDAAKTMKDSPEELNGLAWTIVEMAQGGEDVSKALLDAATNVAEVAVKGAPDSASILDTFSHLLHLQGKLDQAIEVQTKALEMDGGEIPEIKQFLKQLKKEKAAKEEGDDKDSDKN